MNLSIIGVGKLGLTLATSLANSGFNIFAFDSNSTYIKCIKEKKIKLLEPGLKKLLYRNYSRINFFSNDDFDVFNKSNISFLVLPTPSKKNGYYDISYIKKSILQFYKSFQKKRKFHVFVLVSTVNPGDCENNIIPYIEKLSGKKFGTDFDFIYSPEFIAQGSIINDLSAPIILLLAGKYKKNLDKIKKIYFKLFLNNPKVFYMNLKEGELVKILINSYMNLKITFSNSLRYLNKDINPVNSQYLLDIVSYFHAHHKKGFSIGMNYGGPCLPRDNVALNNNIDISNNMSIFDKVDRVNKFFFTDFTKSCMNLIRSTRNETKSVVILGLTYKKNSSDTTLAPGYKILQLIKKNKLFDKIKFYFFDESIDYIETNLFKKKSNLFFLKLKKDIPNAEILIVTKNYKLSKSFKEKFKTIID